ncbi:MAG TPA: 16S rRNA (guanine(966)-N(2))-methyltransferase RsmD [Allosphingosinicella sp.]|nr:16S rRNA (guanine(966)-N(2))-methyltransferase RsmD [Allosphingosinicella sp.]
MRIIAGEWRGRAIEAPPGQGTRPTGDRVREGLFSMLASRIGSFEGLRVADLFAGTGALGLEALSRGAAGCVFVERDHGALAILRRNVAKLGAGERADIRAQAFERLTPPTRPFDLVFMDPPYRSGLAQAAVDRLAAPGWLAAGAWLSVESDGAAPSLPPGLEPEADRRFGKARITLLRKAGC